MAKVILFIILFVFIFTAVFNVLTHGFVNPYTLVMCFGKKGAGKSTLLTKLAIQHERKGWTVYCTENIPHTIFVPYDRIGFVQFRDYHYKPVDPDGYKGLRKLYVKFHEKFFKTKPKILLLVDEVGMIWDNRDYKSFKHEVRNWFKLQRHYYTKVYLFSQTFDIDKKLRDLTDSMYLIQNVGRVFSYGKRIRKFFDIRSSNADASGMLSEGMEFTHFFPFPFLSGNRTLTFIPSWTKYFDSFAAPELEEYEVYESDYDPDFVQ